MKTQVAVPASRMLRWCYNSGKAGRFVRGTVAFVLIGGMFSLAVAGDLDNKTFNQLLSDLDSEEFNVRNAASKQLLEYVDPSSNTRLKVAQLQTLRDYAHGTGSPSLEAMQRASRIMITWMSLNPNTTAQARNFLAGLEIKNKEFDPVLTEGSYKLGDVKIAYDAGGIKFSQGLESAYWDTVNQYSGGLTHRVIPRLEAMKKLVSDLNANDLNSLYFSQGGNQITKDQFVDYLNQQIKKASDLIKKVNNTIGDPPPGPAKPVPVNGMGQIGDSKTFQIALQGGTVTPGSVNFLDLPHSFSLAEPPPGYQFISDIYDLSANSRLKIDGGEIDVSFEYDPSLSDQPPSAFQLVRFADGQYQPFLSVNNDTNDSVINAVYLPPSSGSDLDAFGEFALVAPAPAPEPGSLLLAGSGILCLSGFLRKRLLT